MNKSNIAILVGIIIVAAYMLNLNKKEEMKVEQKDGKEIKEEKGEKKKEEGGWWNNVINCEKNGDNNLYCKPKEKWIFPY
jgi:hypothetical protein